MAITLTNSFEVPAPLPPTWAMLTDIPLVASCLPGATLDPQSAGGGHSAQVDDRFTGEIGIKVGPVSVRYRGELEVLDRNEDEHCVVLRGTGRDQRGGGSVSAIIRMRVDSTGGITRANVETDLDVSGRVAQLGAGAMQQVASRMVGRFVDNLTEHLTVGDVADSPTPDTTAPTTAAARVRASQRKELAASASIAFGITLVLLIAARKVVSRR